MRAHQSLKTLLVASTALAITMPALAADKAAERGQSGQANMQQASSLSMVTQAEALRSMTVVDSQGEEIGKIHDLVVSTQNQSVLYALLSASGTDAGDGIYPIPFSSLKIAEKGSMHGSSEMGSKRDGKTSQHDESRMKADGKDGQQNAAAGSSMQADSSTRAGANGTTGANNGYGRDAEQANSLRQLTVDRLVGMSVQNAAGETISDVENLIIGQGDQPQAILGVGGFLGIGEKLIGVSLDKLRLAENGEDLVTSMTLEDLENARAVEYDDSQVVEGDRTVGSLMGQDGSAIQNQRNDQGQNQAGKSQDKANNMAKSENRDPKSSSAAMSNDKAMSKDKAMSGDKQGMNKADQEKQQNRQAGDSEREMDSLDGKVLVLDISKSDFAKAPSFSKESFPNMAEREWHETVIAFYENLLGEKPDMRLPSADSNRSQ